VPAELSLRGWQLRRNWWLPAIGLVATLGGLALVLTPASRLSVLPFYGGLAIWIGVIFGSACWLRNAFPLARPVALRATAEALVLEGEEPIPTDTIDEAKALTGDEGLPELRLRLRDGSIRWLRLADSDLTMLLRLLEIGAGERRAAFPLQLPFRTRWLAALVVVFLPVIKNIVMKGAPLASLVPESAPILISMLLLATFLAWFAGIFLRGSVVVGADGFTLRWLVFSRFVPFSEVTQIQLAGAWSQRAHDILVSRRRGRALRLSPRETPNTEAARGAEGHALWNQLEAALARAREASHAPIDLADLAPHDRRDAAGWLGSLDSLLQGGGARYRVAAPTPERLADIVRDISQPAEARVGAATALLRHGDGEGRAAVRVATAACADPDLRDTLIALEIAQDDAAFTAALVRAPRSR
jgi:hypothetical protein